MTTIKRFDDWPELLAAFLASRETMPFAWGTNDCGLFACDAVLLMTGVDLADGVRGKYASEEDAAILIYDLEEFAERVAATHGIPAIPVLRAQRGDVCLHISALGPTLGVVAMNGREILIPGPEGLKGIPLKACQKAWRI